MSSPQVAKSGELLPKKFRWRGTPCIFGLHGQSQPSRVEAFVKLALTSSSSCQEHPVRTLVTAEFCRFPRVNSILQDLWTAARTTHLDVGVWFVHLWVKDACHFSHPLYTRQTRWLCVNDGCAAVDEAGNRHSIVNPETRATFPHMVSGDECRTPRGVGVGVVAGGLRHG
jgi:hypothetical protein